MIHSSVRVSVILLLVVLVGSPSAAELSDSRKRRQTADVFEAARKAMSGQRDGSDQALESKTLWSGPGSVAALSSSGSVSDGLTWLEANQNPDGSWAGLGLGSATLL